MSILEVKNITKLYNEKDGVKDISFTIDEQGVYGFLGPNGAGKSTTMNIMTGCLAASEGTVKIGEFDIYKDPVLAKMMIGYLPEMPPLYVERTTREYLMFVAEAKGVVKAERKLEYMAMSQPEKLAYDEHINAVMIQNDVISTAIKEGKAEGRIEGRIEGRKEGRIEGKKEGRKEIILKMKSKGLAPNEIAEFTGITIDEINNLLL